MDQSDPETISAAFVAIGWHKPRTLFERYLAEQEQGHRLAFVAEWRGKFAGYVTLLWVSDYSPFADRQVPVLIVSASRTYGVVLTSADRAARGIVLTTIRD